MSTLESMGSSAQESARRVPERPRVTRRDDARFGDVNVRVFAAPDHAVVDEGAVAADEARVILLSEGGMRLEGPGRMPEAARGRAAVVLTSHGPGLTSIGESRFYVISAQRRHGRSALSGAERHPIIQGALTNVAVALVSSLLDLEDELSWMARSVIERLLSDIVQSFVTESARRRSVIGSDVFTAAISVIAASSEDPRFRARTVAERVNLSLRQTERAFHRKATTISREIRRCRVEHAVELLGGSVLTVDEIARLVGFSNGSSLARAMQTEGLPSPLMVRARAVSPASAR